MRAFVVTAPGCGEVQEVDDLAPTADQLMVDVERVGICGTDIELYSGVMAYIAQGKTHFPLRPGHEWVGRVTSVGPDADASWIGRRITGDTMLGCGTCRFCLAGTHWVCPYRKEVGITDGWPGALAEQQLIPARFAHAIPEHVSVTSGALVEPGGNSLRAADATLAGPGSRVLVLGSGTIGLLAAQFLLARGVDVHLGGKRAGALKLGRDLGVSTTHDLDEVAMSDERFDAVIDATSIDTGPAIAARLVGPAGRIVLIGLSGTPSLVDTRDLVLADVTTVGILSASPGLAGAIEAFASGAVDPDSIVGEVIGLADVASRLEGKRALAAGPGPKVHVDPRL
ncbi:MAG TPA: alcohol dehydrogenase catalytic domain-containing protein [Candidatus Dormibacteraeota bacterium]|nr:alcohol dehydrogenase catalytic domain-containing protein [Candidatus Dormibacteraeota bacterium]